MSSTGIFLLCQFSIIACAVVAGVFLTFSDFVMRSLNGAETAAGIEVMQVINREVFRTVFMVLLLGMSALSPVMFWLAYSHLDGPAGFLVMAGALSYFVGTFAVTMVFNVPMNVQLDTMDHGSAEAAAYWAGTYFPDWTFWNYVRAIAAAVSASCYLAAVTYLIPVA